MKIPTTLGSGCNIRKKERIIKQVNSKCIKKHLITTFEKYDLSISCEYFIFISIMLDATFN